MTVHVVNHAVRVINHHPRLVVLPYRRHVVEPDVSRRAAVGDLERPAVPVRRSVRVVLVGLGLTG